MTASTADPMVALLYGAMTFPSLRAGVEVSADLVAGQPGPWVFSDEDLAERAAEILNRIGISPGVAAGPVVVSMGSVVAACARARDELGRFWQGAHEGLPGHVRHEVEELERRLVAFVDARAVEDQPPAATDPDRVSAGGVPSAQDAAQWVRADWLRFFATSGVATTSVLAIVNTARLRLGLAELISLAHITGKPLVAQQVLDAVNYLTQGKGL